MSDIFRFKRFSIEQAGCAMKVNTDGVLLGALANADDSQHILDIGTGTGVIAVMMAQRFPDSLIDAVEIDHAAATAAERNFSDSIFAGRLNIVYGDFVTLLQAGSRHHKYDCIVSNPPFYINSLHSPYKGKKLAKHAGTDFFASLAEVCASSLAANGQCWFILPPDTTALVTELCFAHGLYPAQTIAIKSFPQSDAHRLITAFSFTHLQPINKELYIYDKPNVYSIAYKEVLKDFLIIF